MAWPPLPPLENAIAEAWPPADWAGLHVVLAVSGGPDSVALLRGMMAIKEGIGGPGQLLAAHFNHGVRGSAANEDQAWLEELCRRSNIPLHVGHVDGFAPSAVHDDGWEAAARELRYDFLRQSAEKLGARWVAVGHTADDQVETVLHRILRGTGLAGLGGIPMFRPLSPCVTLVRPLLGLRRRAILQYLADIGQDYRVDATNAELHRTRNRLRHELLPIVRAQFNPDVDEALLRLRQQAAEAQQLIAATATKLLAECVRADPGPDQGSITIDCRSLSRQPELVVREVCKIAWTQAGWPLQAMGFDQWQQLATMMQASARVGPVNLPGGIRATRAGDILLLKSGGAPPPVRR